MPVKLYFVEHFTKPPVYVDEYYNTTISPTQFLFLLRQKLGFDHVEELKILECLCITTSSLDFSTLGSVYTFKKDETEVRFGLKICVRLFNATQHLMSRKPLVESFYSSWENRSMESIFTAFYDRFPGRYITSEQIPATPELLCKNLKPIHNIFVVPERSKYSDCNIVTISSKVRFHQSIGKKRSAGNDLPNSLEAIHKACLGRLSVLYTEGTGSTEGFNSSKFQAVVDTIASNLKDLHDGYAPSDQLSQAGRRLIIDFFICKICPFLEKTYRVEEHIFKQSNPGELGWGPFDYSFSDATICRTNVEGFDETYEALEGESMEVVEVEDVTEVEQPGVGFPEAKVSIELQGYCQLAAQLHDIASLRNISPVLGILSTGTHWKFFKLFHHEDRALPETAKIPGDTRYVMVLDDTASLKIIKPLTARRQSSTTDASLNREDIQRIAAFLVMFL